MEPIIDPPHEEDQRIAKEERRQSSTIYDHNQKQKDDGGFVYPSHEHIGEKNIAGITRRDWLAGLAMQGLLSNHEAISALKRMVEESKQSALGKELASLSYQLADAMIAGSNK